MNIYKIHDTSPKITHKPKHIKQTRVIMTISAQQIPKLILNVDHQQNHNSKYPQLCTKRKKENKNEKKERVE